MSNDDAPPRQVPDPWEGIYAWRFLAFPIGVYGLAFFQAGPLPQIAVGFWAFGYVVCFPLIIWHIAIRPERGDLRRAAWALAAGGLPLAFYLLMWDEVTTRQGLLWSFPVVAAAGIAGITVAHRPPRLEPTPP